MPRGPVSSARRAREAVDRARKMRDFASPAPIALRLWLAPRLTILSLPKVPSRHQALFRLCALNGYGLTDDPGEPHDLAVNFVKNGGATGAPGRAKALRILSPVFRSLVERLMDGDRAEAGDTGDRQR